MGRARWAGPRGKCDDEGDAAKIETRLPATRGLTCIFSCIASRTSIMSDNGENDQVYNNSHRAFLQSFLSRATLTFKQARPIVAAIEKAQGT
jgi:hypothetical protein